MIRKMCYLFLGISMCHAVQWQNWARNQQCNVILVSPSNIAELKAVVNKARKEKKQIRSYGTGHSWSDIVCTDGYVINTEKLNKIVSIDLAHNQVTVQAGIKLKDLNNQLAKLGLSLSNQGAITEQSLAGVVSTATHGSGKTGSYASFITKVKLLTADGNEITISENENMDLWPAVRTSIGSLGIMTELTVQCEPLFKLRQETKKSDWAQMLIEYQEWLKANDYMQCYWNASNDSVEVTIHNRTTANKKTRITQKIKEFLNFNNVDYSYKMLAGTLWQIYMEEEIAIPRSKFIEAAQAIRQLVKEEYEKTGLFSGILFRFVAAEKNNILSPAADRDVVFFSAITHQRSGYEPFFEKMYSLLLQFNGRPHWGKINYLTQEDAKRLYATNYENFVKIRKKLDPNGLFSNEFTKRVFGW